MKLDISEIVNFQELKPLLSLAINLQKICVRLGTWPIIYGSVAYSVHTNDWSNGVNDVDFLVKEALFDGLADAVSRDVPDAQCEITTYHSLKILKNSLKISFDSIEHYLKTASGEFTTVSIDGNELHLLNRISLLGCYQQGVETIPSKSEIYAAKANVLSLAIS